jgi:hypothetical protein
MINLEDVAQETVQREDLSAREKVSIVRAIERAAPNRLIFEGIEDVERLALENPDEYERLLRGYHLLLGGAERTRRGRAA